MALERSKEGGAPRLAGAPISWGVCEVPGWGVQLPPERVLAEMAALGLTATELGAQGWLPLDADRHGLKIVAGFVPVVVGGSTVEAVEQLATVGAEIFVAALVQDLDWSQPRPLDDDGWKRAGAHLHELANQVAREGLTLVLHPHVGTLVETAEEVERALEHTDVPFCLDTGHLLIGGVDPARFLREHAGRVGHVHLKDIDAAVAERLRRGELSLVQAVQAGLFRPLGDGDGRIDEVVRLLDDMGYERWLVLEQDLAITGTEPPVGGGPALDVARSIEFLSRTAPRRERVSLP
jgi:inosose dehydratase